MNVCNMYYHVGTLINNSILPSPCSSIIPLAPLTLGSSGSASFPPSHLYTQTAEPAPKPLQHAEWTHHRADTEALSTTPPHHTTTPLTCPLKRFPSYSSFWAVLMTTSYLRHDMVNSHHDDQATQHTSNGKRDSAYSMIIHARRLVKNTNSSLLVSWHL